MRCPECGSDNLIAQAHLIYLSDLEFKIIDGKLEKIKRSVLKDIRLEERRYFILCNDCDYETENLLTDITTGYEVNDEKSIIEQIREFISYKPKRKVVDYEKKYLKFLASNPSGAEISEYMAKNVKTTERMKIYDRLVRAYFG